VSDVPLLKWRRALAVSVFLAGSSIALSAPAAPTSSTVPTSLEMKVYRFAFSESPMCEKFDPNDIHDIDNPTFADFTKNPTLGTASIPLDRVYHCVAFEVDQLITLTPSGEAGGACAPTPQNFDFCAGLEALKTADGGVQSGSSGDGGASAPPPPSNPVVFDGVLPLGGDVSSAFKECAPGGSHFVIYLSTAASDNPDSNIFRPPVSASDTSHGLPLGAPLHVGAHTTASLVVTVRAVDPGVGTKCFIGEPKFSFTSSNDP
jgi:hypothetical protein